MCPIIQPSSLCNMCIHTLSTTIFDHYLLLLLYIRWATTTTTIYKPVCEKINLLCFFRSAFLSGVCSYSVRLLRAVLLVRLSLREDATTSKVLLPPVHWVHLPFRFLICFLSVYYQSQFDDADGGRFCYCYFSRLKAELQLLRKKGALKSTTTTTTTTSSAIAAANNGATTQQQQQQQQQCVPSSSSSSSSSNSRCCARCRTSLGRIINRGALCKSCRQRVCKACREYGSPSSKGGSGIGGGSNNLQLHHHHHHNHHHHLQQQPQQPHSSNNNTDWLCTVCYKAA